MKKSNNNDNIYLQLTVIVVLVGFLFVGKLNVVENTQLSDGVSVSSLTRLQKGTNLDYYKSLGKDLTVFLKNFKKTDFRAIDKEIDNSLVPRINSLNNELSVLQERESLLQSQLSSIPNEEYTHSKIELSSFIVEELKKQSLVYEINYNYVQEAEVPTTDATQQAQPAETTETTEAVSAYTNCFSIKVFNINEGDNYNKLITVLDTIFIKEPYEILNTHLGYDEITQSYYLVFAIQV